MHVNPVQEIEAAEEKAAKTIEAAREKRTAILKAAGNAAAEESARRMKDAEQKVATLIQEAQKSSNVLSAEDLELDQIRKHAREKQPSCVEEILLAIPGLIQ